MYGGYPKTNPIKCLFSVKKLPQCFKCNKKMCTAKPRYLRTPQLRMQLLIKSIQSLVPL